jgi:membrane associated rhomboid family serine protease
MLSRLPPATRYLLIANIVCSVVVMLVPSLFGVFGLWPWLPGEPMASQAFMPWQPITHAFVHADPVHLMFNMLGLTMFGTVLESHWNTRRYLIFYGVCALGAALCQFGLATWQAYESGRIAFSVGASGGIYGLLVAFGLLFPNHRIGLFFLPMTFKARHFVIALIGLQLVLALFGGRTGESHVAHLGGAFFGWALIRYWARDRKPPPKGPPPRRRPKHLRAVP